MNIDLDQPQFALSQAVTIVPGLTADMVQNWDKRKILSKETAMRARKNAQLRWTLRHLMVMRVLVEAGRFGIKPSAAIDIARYVADEADEFVENSKFGESQRSGVPQYLFNSDAKNNYRRAIISILEDGSYDLSLFSLSASDYLDGAFRVHSMNVAYLILEADLIFADTINAAAYVLAGFDPLADGVLINAKEG